MPSHTFDSATLCSHDVISFVKMRQCFRIPVQLLLCESKHEPLCETLSRLAVYNLMIARWPESARNELGLPYLLS